MIQEKEEEEEEKQETNTIKASAPITSSLKFASLPQLYLISGN